MLKKKEFNKKEKEKKERGFPSESEPQGEPIGASHRCVGAWRLEINSDGVVVWSGGDGGFSLFLSFRSSLSLTPILSLRLDVGFGLLWIFVVGLSDWRGLEIKTGSRDWRLTAMAWWFGDWRRWHGGLEWRRWSILSLSLTSILSLILDVGFGFALNFFAGSIRIVLLFFSFFFRFDFVVGVSISNGICISSQAWIFLVGLPYLQSQ